MSGGRAYSGYQRLEGQLFDEKPRPWNDIPWIGLWAAHFIAVVVIFGIYGNIYLSGTLDFGTWAKLLITIFSVMSVIGGGFALVWLAVIRLLRRSIVIVSLVLWPLLLVGFGIYFAVGLGGAAIGQAVILFVIAAFSILVTFIARHKIPFAEAMMDAASAAIVELPGTLVVNFVTIFLNIGLFIFYAFFLALCWLQDWNPYGLIFFTWLSYSWTTGVTSAVAHCTTAGGVSAWWINQSSRAATTASLKHSLTSNFGSICFGTLFVAIMDGLRATLFQVCNNPCLRWLLNLITRAIEYFNAYAFVHVAIYNDTYCKGASNTVELFKKSGLNIIINDGMTSRVIVVGAYLGGLACGGIGVGWYHTAQSNIETWEDFFIFWVCYLIGFAMVRDGLSIVWSAIATSFVLWSEDPNCMNIGQQVHFQQLVLTATNIWGTKTAVTWGPEGEGVAMTGPQTTIEIDSPNTHAKGTTQEGTS